MRILVVTNLFPPVVRGGYEIECGDIVQHLRRLHDVQVVTSSHRRREAPPEDGVLRVLPFSDGNRMGTLRAPASALRGVRVIRRVLATSRPEIVYVWNGAGLPHAVLRELNLSGIPVAYRICQQWFGDLYSDLFMRYLSGTYEGSARIWAWGVRMVNRLPALHLGDHDPVDVAICWNSEFLRSTVAVPRGLRPVLEHVVHPINSAADEMARLTPEPRGDRPVVLFVGRVSPEKGVDLAIRSVAVLEREHGVVVVLRIVGDGDPAWTRKLKDDAAALGIADRVSFLGRRTGADLRAEIAQASVWLVPSLWDEPAGMVAIEAGLARIPLVASRVGGIPELLREPDEALMFTRGNAEECAAAIAATLAGGQDVENRVQCAHRRSQELSFAPYLTRMDRFLTEAAARLGVQG